MEEEDGSKARSFRDEDYLARRVFLRSYPLYWGGAGDEAEDGRVVDEGIQIQDVPAKFTKTTHGKKGIKKIILLVIQLGEGSILVFRRFKSRIGMYVIHCTPVRFKTPTISISAK